MRNLSSYEKKAGKPEFFRLSFRNGLTCFETVSRTPYRRFSIALKMILSLSDAGPHNFHHGE